MREWELSFRLGMRPWIAVAYSAPVAAASAVFIIYPIGQGSFSDGYTKLAQCILIIVSLLSTIIEIILTKKYNLVLYWSNPTTEFYLKGENPDYSFNLSSKKNKLLAALTAPLIYHIGGAENLKRSLRFVNIKTNAKKRSNSGPNLPNSGDDNSQDNPLLNNENKAVGETICFDIANSTNIPNTPGVYCIRSKQNNMHYVGETQNLKSRILQHQSSLRMGEHPNSKLQEEFFLLGDENLLEFIIHQKGENWENFDARKARQDALIIKLKGLNLCFNSGTAETTNPRPAGEFPSQGGVFFMLCNATDKTFFGYTTQADGIGGRIRSIIYKLKNKTYGSLNNNLQSDWNTYGREGFTISGYAWGATMSNENDCKTLVNQLIYNTLNQGKEVYNSFYYGVGGAKLLLSSTREQIGIPSTPPRPPMDFSQGEVFEFSHPTDPTKPVIRLTGRKFVFAHENVYLSFKEAASCLEINDATVKSRMVRGEYTVPTLDQVREELLRRDWSTEKDKAANNPQPSSGKGKSRAVEIDGVYYSTIAAAASAKNVSTTTIRKRIENPNLNYKYVDNRPSDS